MSNQELKTLALQIAIQLPGDREKALRALELTRELVTGWVYAERAALTAVSPGESNVVSLNGKPDTSPR